LGFVFDFENLLDELHFRIEPIGMYGKHRTSDIAGDHCELLRLLI